MSVLHRDVEIQAGWSSGRRERVPAWIRKANRKLAKFVARFEGFPDEQPYNDPVGHCTAGFGHLIHLGNCTLADRKRWGKITGKQARRLLRKDLRPYRAAVKRLIDRRLRRRELNALTSFTFNNGIGSLEGSTLRRRLNSREGRTYRGRKRIYREELPRWDKGGSPLQVLPGLVIRRRAEVRLACTGKYR